jgi:cysteine desulfuration protein SufE
MNVHTIPQPIHDVGKRIAREFGVLRSWQDKYAYIIELGKKLPAIDPAEKKEANLIHGCQSNVWLTAEYSEDRLWLRADADSSIVKGLVALMIRFYNGQPLADIAANDPQFIQEIGMDRHFSATRANGLRAMTQRIKSLAQNGTQTG